MLTGEVYKGGGVWLEITLVEAQHSVLFLPFPLPPQDVAAECEVKCMPTFQFFKKGQKVGTSDLISSWPVGKHGRN